MRALLFILMFPALCSAADWKPIPGTDSKYDAASLSKSGEGVKVWLQGRDGKANDQWYDCRAGAYPPGSPGSPNEAHAKALCKKPYEFWK